jgi:hypothetical protein
MYTITTIISMASVSIGARRVRARLVGQPGVDLAGLLLVPGQLAIGLARRRGQRERARAVLIGYPPRASEREARLRDVLQARLGLLPDPQHAFEDRDRLMQTLLVEKRLAEIV